MLMQRLQSEEFLPVNFKEYYTFSLHGTTANAHSLRFSLNASSVDACYAVFCDGNYMSNGIKMQLDTSEHAAWRCVMLRVSLSSVTSGSMAPAL